jgi:DNA-binding PadR family transcriptional regulator
MSTTTTHSPKRSPFAIPVVLGLLDQQPRHGYALFLQVQRDLQDVWHVGMNRLYALLEVMERDGLIKGHAERAGLRPPRRVFHLTAKGKRLFERWLHEPSARMSDMRTDFPPKLYFALQRGLQDVAELVQTQRGACHRELERMSGRQRDATDNVYRGLIYDFRIRQIHAILEWLDGCEAQLVAARVTQRKAHQAKRKAA